MRKYNILYLRLCVVAGIVTLGCYERAVKRMR